MLNFYAVKMVAKVLDRADLVTMLRLHGYTERSDASTKYYETDMYDYNERYLTGRFYDNMFDYCGQEINIKRFPVNIEIELGLKEQFMSTFPLEINGHAWHEQWFVPGSFRRQE